MKISKSVVVALLISSVAHADGPEDGWPSQADAETQLNSPSSLLAFPIVGFDRRAPISDSIQSYPLSAPLPTEETSLWIFGNPKERPPRQDECESGGC